MVNSSNAGACYDLPVMDATSILRYLVVVRCELRQPWPQLHNHVQRKCICFGVFSSYCSYPYMRFAP